MEHIENRLAAPVATCCCYNKGTTNINYVLQKDVVGMDEQITVSAMADHTDFKLSIDNLKAELIRTICLKNRKGETKMLKKKLWSASMGKIDKGTKDTEYRNLPIQIYAITDDQAPKSLSGALSEFAGRVQQSVSGELVNVSYSVELNPDFSGMVCGGNYRVKFPIEILAPEKVYQFVQMSVGPPGGYPPEDPDSSGSYE